MKRDSSAFLADFPRESQVRFKRLGLPVEANQDAARQIPNRFRGFFLDQQGVESFWLAVETKVEFAARRSRFRTGGGWPEPKNGNKEKNRNAAHHCATS